MRHKRDPVPTNETEHLKETVYFLALAFSSSNHPKPGTPTFVQNNGDVDRERLVVPAIQTKDAEVKRDPLPLLSTQMIALFPKTA